MPLSAHDATYLSVLTAAKPTRAGLSLRLRLLRPHGGAHSRHRIQRRLLRPARRSEEGWLRRLPQHGSRVDVDTQPEGAGSGEARLLSYRERRGGSASGN